MKTDTATAILHEIVLHRGPLTLASLDASIRGSIFRPASKATIGNKRKRGLYHLGWEYVPPERSYDFVLQDLAFVTAEGAVSLAALVDCLRNSCKCQVQVKIDSKEKRWIEALRLDQLINDRWLASFPNMPLQVQESWTFPLWRYCLGDARDCKQTAERMSRQVEQILGEVNYDLADEVASAVRTIFTEGLLNILEHAYPARQDRVTFEAITVTPVPEIGELRKRAYVTAEELSWFEEHDGRLMIEVAVADIGKSVPATLGKAYCGEHPEICADALGLRLGVTVDQILRAKLHHSISHWAFDHKSTRKTPKEFHSELALLNWRGLHRALNTTARFGGCLVMRSGQARAGYAFCEDQARPLSPTSIRQHEFPGTTLILRFPIIRGSQWRAIGRLAPENTIQAAPVIEPERILGVGSGDQGLESFAPGHVRTVGIAHPFRHYKEDEIKQLLHMIRQIPPHIVSFHFFASLESPLLSGQLSAFQEPSSMVDLGPPRLTAFHKGGENLVWKFVGVLPTFARPLIAALEKNGIATVGSDFECRAFAKRLVQAYDPFVRINGSSLELIHFNAEVSDESYRQAMQRAFIDWAQENSPAWTFERPGEIVRLPTGRRVKKYVSVLKALYSEDLFAQAMGWRLSSILRALRLEYPQLCIVTESEASYFISRILLLDYEEHIDIFIGSPEGHLSDRPIVVFADAINKAETFNLLLQSCGNCVAAICGIDLREKANRTISEKNIPIESLVEYPFDPIEVSTGPTETGGLVLEVDAVTHIPYEGPTTEILQIGTSDQRNVFIGEHERLFRFGLHRSGGRLHTFSLRNDVLIRSHQEQLCDWIESVIADVIRQLPKSKRVRSIVIFTRNEASIKDITQNLGRKLEIRFDGVDVFTAVIPVVPAGLREVFSRPAQLLFHGLQSLSSRELFAPAPVDFLAVYLDDACVTGKTLLNFLIQVSKAGSAQLPLGVVAIPTLSRFSPAEETFYSEICKNVSLDRTGKEVPFSFHPLFRLQIRSSERLQALPLYELIAELSSKQSALDVRLQGYVQRIMQNIMADLSNPVRGNPEVPAFQYPFYTGRKGETSAASDRTLWIRHLLALLEQNVGVLSEVLIEILLACNDDDDSLLTMLVLEPDLLNTRPISKECRLDLTNLAMRALGSEKTELGVKSDALAIIAMQGQPLANRIVEILGSISGVPDLIDQFLVFLLTQLPSQKIPSATLGQAILDCEGVLSADEYAYVRGCIKSFSETSEPSNIHSRSGALQALKKLIAGTSIHGQGHSAIKAINNWLLRTPKDRNSLVVADVRLMTAEALAAVRSAIVPGLNGLHWWAERISYNLHAALAFRDAWFQVLINVNNLEAFLDTLEEGPIGGHAANRIEELWITIRESSQINAPDSYLSGSIIPSSHRTPVIERWAPEFLCAPFEVAVHMALKLRITLDISSSWELNEQGLYVVVTPIPLVVINELFRLLIEDMQKHGSEDSFAIRFFLRDVEGKESLVAEFCDIVAVNDIRGSGKSQSRAKALANQHRFSVTPDSQKRAGEPYKVTVLFPTFLYIKCE